MSDQEAPEQKSALTIVGLLVAAVVVAILGFGIWKALPHSPDRTATSTESAATAGRIERIYFQLGKDQLPPEAADVLDRVAKAPEPAPRRSSPFRAFTMPPATSPPIRNSPSAERSR